MSSVNDQIFGANEVAVKYVLEGHERGINWASFHPTLPLIVSCADDRQVKLWRMNESKAWEIDTMRGHTYNVSCALFHPKHELIISNSEDRCIRVWDIPKRQCVLNYRKETDRFWILATHPEQNIFAAGHDNGMVVFKLESERPLYDVVDSRIYYVKDRFLRCFDVSSGRDVSIVTLRKCFNSSPGVSSGVRKISYNLFNKADSNLLVTSSYEGGVYDLVLFNENTNGEPNDVRRGQGVDAVFVGRDRMAVLDRSKRLSIKDFQGSMLKQITSPMSSVDALFFCGISGRLVLKNEENILYYDQQARKALAEISLPRVKFVVWNEDFSKAAMVSKHSITLVNKQFEQLCSVTETVRINSGVWLLKSQVFVYSTFNHVKYIILDGDRGILRTLETPIYAAKFSGLNLYYLDTEAKMKTLEIDLAEVQLKIALAKKDYPEVTRLIKSSKLCGQAIISYLYDKGHPDVALNFVKDPKMRFKLALACGNIPVAISVAHDIGEEAWRELGVEALRQGNHEVVEMAYQKTKEFERLSFLYLITGNSDKMKKMLKIAEVRGDLMSRFHNSLLLGDADERVKILEMAGQPSLAYLTAATHGLADEAERLKTILEANNITLPKLHSKPSLLQPPTPIMRGSNWPLLAIATSKGMVLSAEGTANKQSSSALRNNDDEYYESNENRSNEWGDDDLGLSDEEDDRKAMKSSSNGNNIASSEAKAAWGDVDLDLSDDDDDDDKGVISASTNNDTSTAAGGTFFSAPQAGNPATTSWCSESSHASDHFAAGSVETALQLLNRQIAAVNVAQMKSAANSIAVGSIAYLPGIPLTLPNKSYLTKSEISRKTNKNVLVPVLSLKVSHLLEYLKDAYKAFTSAQFAECQMKLEMIVERIPLALAMTKQESNDTKELLEICREYITALRLKALMTNESAAEVDTTRQLEYAAYFTHCNLQPAHLTLALKSAMASAFKSKNFVNAASFARRLLEQPEMASERNAESRSKAQKVLQKSEKEGRNEFKVDYDEMNPFKIDCYNLKPIYKGAASCRCPYCGSTYLPDFKGKVCVTCNIASVGVETVGLVTMRKET